MLNYCRVCLSHWKVLCLTFLSVMSPVAGIAQEAEQDASDANGLKQVIAIKDELSADVRALIRVAEYQSELLKLARIDPDAARAGRRAQENCTNTTDSKELCDALSASYGGGSR
jgi:hypothetical protein